jgi:hypothetical protein
MAFPPVAECRRWCATSCRPTSFPQSHGFRRAPFANTQHDGTTGCIQRGSNVCVGCFRVLRRGIAPVILQVVDAPRRVLNCILIFVAEPARPPGTGLSSRHRSKHQISVRASECNRRPPSCRAESAADRQQCCPAHRGSPANSRRCSHIDIPASFIPDLTTASAMLLIMSSLTLQANLFHEFHPMGGVRARVLDIALLSWPSNGNAEAKPARITTKRITLVFIEIVVPELPKKQEGQRRANASWAQQVQSLSANSSPVECRPASGFHAGSRSQVRRVVARHNH